jgi:drug/metabolite transporter (DMT)-like permease
MAVIWGYNWVAMKVGVQYAPPFTFAAIRMFLGAVTLFMILLILRRPLRPPVLGLTALLGLLQTSASVGLAMWALDSGGAGKTSVLSYTMPFWLLPMAWVALGERPNRVQWMAIAFAFAGLVLILTPWRMHGVFSSLLALGSALCWAASAIVAKVLRGRHEVDLLSLTAWQMLLGSLPLILVALLAWRSPVIWSGSFVAVVAFTVVPATALAWALWLFVLHTLRAGTAGLVSLAVPLIGVTSAWLQLGERPTMDEALGMAAIVGALTLITWREILNKPEGTTAESPALGSLGLAVDGAADRPIVPVTADGTMGRPGSG